MNPDVDYESAMAKLRATARDFGVAAPTGDRKTKKRDSLTHPYNAAPRTNRGLTSSAVSRLRMEVTGQAAPSVDRDSVVLRLKGELTNKEVEIIELKAKAMGFDNATAEVERRLGSFVEQHKRNAAKLKAAKTDKAKAEKEWRRRVADLEGQNKEMLHKYRADGVRLDAVNQKLRQDRVREEKRTVRIQLQDAELKQLRKQLVEAKKTAQGEAKKYQKELNSLKGSLQSSLSSVQEAKTLNLKFTEATKQLEDITHAQQMTIDDRQSEVDRLKQNMDKQTRATEAAYKARQQETKNVYERKLGEHAKQVEALQKRVRGLTEDQDQVIGRNAELVRDGRRLQERFEATVEQLEGLHQQLEEVETEKFLCLETNAALMAKCEEYMSERETGQVKMETLVANQATTDSDLARVRGQLELKVRESDELHLACQALQIELNDSQADAHAAQLEMETEAMELEGRLKVLELETMEQRGDLERKNQVIDVMTLELSVAKEDSVAAQARISELEDLYSADRHELQTRSGTIAKQGADMLKHKKLLVTLQQHCQSQQVQLEEVTAQLADKSGQQLKLMQAVTNARNEKELVESQLLGKVGGLEGKVMLLGNELEQARQAMVEGKLANNKLNTMLQQTRGSVVRLQDEKQGAELALQSFKETQDVEVQSARQKANMLQTQALEYTQRIQRLTHERAELKMQVSRSTRQLELLESDLKSKSSAIRNQQAALEQSQSGVHSDVAVLTQELEKSEHSCAVLHGEKTDLETQLSSLQGKMDALQLAQHSAADMNELKLKLQRKSYENEILFNQVATLREAQKHTHSQAAHEELVGCGSCADLKAMLTAKDREIQVLYTQIVELGECCGSHEEETETLRTIKSQLQKEMAQKQQTILELTEVNKHLFQRATEQQQRVPPSSSHGHSHSGASESDSSGGDEPHGHCMEHCPVRVECWKLAKDIASQVNQLSALMDLSNVAAPSSQGGDAKSNLPFLSPLRVRDLRPNDLDAKDAMFDNPNLILHEVNKNLSRFNASMAEFYSTGMQDQCIVS